MTHIRHLLPIHLKYTLSVPCLGWLPATLTVLPRLCDYCDHHDVDGTADLGSYYPVAVAGTAQLMSLRLLREIWPTVEWSSY